MNTKLIAELRASEEAERCFGNAHADLLARAANAATQAEASSAIIEGFLDRFEAPTCIEQQEVVNQAFAWLHNYYADNFAAQAISQQNQNDNQNHTD